MVRAAETIRYNLLLLLPELFLGGLASAFISRTSSKIRAIAITSTNIR